MAEWKNLTAIEQDLFVAQGRPISIDTAYSVSYNNQPPVYHYHEETEEEFFKDCNGDVDFTIPPELGLIKDMLTLVKEEESIKSDEDDDFEKHYLIITKIPSTIPEVTPNIVEAKKKRNRNVAMTSILEAIGEAKADPIINKSIEEVPSTKIKAPTRNGCIPKANIKAALDVKAKTSTGSQKGITDLNNTKGDNLKLHNKHRSVNQEHVMMNINIKTATDSNGRKSITGFNNGEITLSNKSNHTAYDKSVKPAISMNEMYKTQHVSLKIANPSKMFQKKDSTVKPVGKISSQSSSLKCDNSYKPSELANEYYQKFVERNEMNKLKESEHQDIWTKTEQRMKEIDARRKIEAELIVQNAPIISHTGLTSAAHDSDFDELFAAHAYKLPLHRHIWTDDCLICEMMEKHKHDVKFMMECPELLEPPTFLTDNDKEDIS